MNWSNGISECGKYKIKKEPHTWALWMKHPLHPGYCRLLRLADSKEKLEKYAEIFESSL